MQSLAIAPVVSEDTSGLTHGRRFRNEQMAICYFDPSSENIFWRTGQRLIVAEKKNTSRLTLA
jgi:hypothetical protein